MQPNIYYATDHDIAPEAIDPDALYVLKKLKEAGFIAYLVGGSVRDLLIKKTPKDFDISTSARPEEVKQLFQRNCILIGRRFRLAHVRFGHKVIEVATFRAGENDEDLIIQDNIWGTAEEDVLRRDFTINGLFYDPTNHAVIDYVGGWNDIHNHLLRTIGEPVMRFRQDPVRMLRLLKFKARYGFDIEQKSLLALTRCKQEIVKSSPARILEEILRMMESGASEPFFRLMTHYSLLELLFPCLEHFLNGKHGEDVFRLLKAADQVNTTSGKKPLERSILTACLLYPILEREIQATFLDHGKRPHFGEVIAVTNAVIKGLVISSFSHFPRRLSADLSYILANQFRLVPLESHHGRRRRLLSHREFDIALKFLRVRAIVDDTLREHYDWWSQQPRPEVAHGERHGRRRPPKRRVEHE